MFEYYRKAKGIPATDAVLVGSKPKLDAVAYSTHAAYGAAYGASVDLTAPTDYGTYDRLINRLDTNHPHFVMASFAQVDQKAHAGDWNAYLRQMEIVDLLLVLHMRQSPASDSSTRGKPRMFITADHGRHDDAHGGFAQHGDTCDGCTHVIFMALGPDIRADYEVTSLYTQRDVCVTIGELLGVPTPESDGFPMAEIFEPISTGVGD